jgi:hypothetical protein
VADLEQQRQRFVEENAELAVIGSGAVSHLKSFRGVTGYKGKLFSDPSRETFRILGLTSGVSGLIGRKSISRAFSALRRGILPGSLQGSALQLGGAIVVSPQESILYSYRSSEAGDDPPVEEILKAVSLSEKAES